MFGGDLVRTLVPPTWEGTRRTDRWRQHQCTPQYHDRYLAIRGRHDDASRCRVPGGKQGHWWRAGVHRSPPGRGRRTDPGQGHPPRASELCNRSARDFRDDHSRGFARSATGDTGSGPARGWRDATKRAGLVCPIGPRPVERTAADQAVVSSDEPAATDDPRQPPAYARVWQPTW